MATEEFYSARQVDGINVVTFRMGHILDAVAIDRMATSLKELIDASADARFVFDFQYVTYLSSSALRMLIELQRRIGQGKARMKLAGISDDLMELFRMTKLDTWFDIYKTSEAAVEAQRKNL
jgi:anti-sigma B factor antagonist